MLQNNLEGPALIYAVGFSAWKKARVRQCFPSAQVRFANRFEDVPVRAVVAVWGMQCVPESQGFQVLRLEDGFLRSVGLGADLTRPTSWVVDDVGLYYDATRPSKLELLLAETVFDPEQLQRATALQQRIVSAGLTKYNIGTPQWSRPKTAKRVLLVPGQVESDASLAYGAPEIRTNMGLLQAVRRANPDAYIVYKPHPDVVAGLRAEGNNEHDAQHWCDEILLDAAMAEVLASVDEVHVLTSLTGFEALLRNQPVYCYGQPFYAGWGLTNDAIAHPRRTRRLTLAELVAGTLIAYPLYLSRVDNALITPEQALEQLLAWRNQAGAAAPWWQAAFRMVLRRVVGVR